LLLKGSRARTPSAWRFPSLVVVRLDEVDPREEGVVDQVAGLAGQREVQGNDVRLARRSAARS
jgi:hypothetical protein